MRPSVGYLFTLLCLSFSPAVLQAEWVRTSLPFQATAISRKGNSFWACGTDLTIASSSDGGVHWDLRTRKTDGGTLLSIGWADEKFGFAGGTGGLLLLTSDGGETWQPLQTATADPILDLSFADSQPRDGVAAPTKRTVNLTVNVIKSD